MLKAQIGRNEGINPTFLPLGKWFMKIEYTTRAAEPDDLNFIVNSWLRSNRHRWNWVENPQYFTIYKNHILYLINKGVVVLACNTEDAAQIYGYIVFDLNIMHYVYVKLPFRKMGLASDLVALSQCNEATIGNKLISNINKIHLLIR